MSTGKQMLISDLNLVKSLTLAGLGIALLPTFYCFSEARNEKLIRVLGEWRSNLRPVHFVYPQQDFVPKKLSAFLSIGTELIRSNLEKFLL